MTGRLAHAGPAPPTRIRMPAAVSIDASTAIMMDGIPIMSDSIPSAGNFVRP